jgi:predicted nucleic acid-binding protein
VILVDTSVWVEALRRRGREALRLGRLFDEDAVLLAGPVRIEILSGASRRDRDRLRRLLSALPVVHPQQATWERLDGWVDVAGEARQRFGFADLLIGALAAEHDAAVWSLDYDFVRLARLGLVRLHEPAD